MPVNLNQYRGIVRTFNNRNYYHKLTLSLGQPYQSTFFLNCAFLLCDISFLFTLLISVFPTLRSNPWLYSLLILSSTDDELIPGPKRSSTRNISICDWNLNSMSAHNYIKLFLLKAYKFTLPFTSLTIIIWQFQGIT